jgi:CHASE2 domain-containing sensor protein
VIIVSVDEGSNDELELPWPWPRELHAKFLDLVSRGRPAVIGLDILFAEPSGRGESDDAALAAGIERAGNVVLAAALTVVREPGSTRKISEPLPRGAPEALTILAGAFAVWAGSTRRPFRAFAVVSGAGVAYLGLTHVAFLGWRYWIPAVSVPLALAVGYSGAAMQNFLNEQREKRRLSRFFSPSVLREIVRSQDAGESLQ